MPPRHRQLLDVARDYYDKHAACLYTDNTAAELADGQRVMATTALVAALAQYAAHAPLVPRLAESAGFELGTGIGVNPVPPEHAAALLRRTLLALADVDGGSAV